jgi:hypothetical protein
MKSLNKLMIVSMFIFLISLNLIFAISIKDVSSSPQEVAPGETINIEINIENIFEDDMYNLNVKLDLSGNIPFAPYLSSSEKFLDEIEEGKEEDFNFKLIVLPETNSGIYKIPVEISYEDEEGNVSLKSELISVIVNSQPELKISLEEDILIRGEENIFSIKIVNSGLADVKFVYLNINDNDEGINFLSGKEQYIGDIDSDDFDNVEYKIHLNEKSLGIINLAVVLKFKDSTNKEFTKTENLILKTYSLKQAQDLGLVKKQSYIIYIIGGILVFSYFGYRIRKKRKLKKRTY